MDWGIANAEPQPVIAPSAGVRARERRGDPVPACPDWMCLTSPEYACGTANLDHYKADKTIEELAAIEVKKRAKEALRLAVVEERHRLADEARERKKAMDAAEKLARAERAKVNKKAGFKRGKCEARIIYANYEEIRGKRQA
jgi:hypothetical protein